MRLGSWYPRPMSSPAEALRQAMALQQEGRLEEAGDFITFQLKYFERYCEGLAGTRSLVAQLHQVASVSRQQWNRRSAKEISLRHHKGMRAEADHRSAKRADWADYLPDPHADFKSRGPRP